MQLKPGQLLFGIGMNKTGTCSLDLALRKLGIKCLHHSATVHKHVKQNRAAHRKLLWGLTGRYQAFCDSPIPYLVEEIVRDYPDSRYILTVREIKGWVKSRLRHLGGTVEHHLSEWKRHLDRLEANFAPGMAGILVYDLCGGDGWEPLCEWLSVPVPDIPFPHKNRTKDRRVRMRSQAKGWKLEDMRREVAKLDVMEI